MLVHASGALPIWLEVSLATDSHYPLARNIAWIVALFCLPYVICLLLSHRLYRLRQTNAPLISCALSLAMLIGPFALWYLARGTGERAIIVIPLVLLQNLAGIAAFALLRVHYSRRASGDVGRGGWRAM